MPKQPEDFEKAEFTDFRRRRLDHRWAILAGVLVLLLAAHGVARDILYRRVLQKIAQGAFNGLASASIHRISDVSLDAQGDVTLHGAVVTTERRGHRVLIEAERVRLTFDGMP